MYMATILLKMQVTSGVSCSGSHCALLLSTPNLPLTYRQLAAELGIVASDIDRRSAGRSMDAGSNARHARFAAACAVEQTVSEQPVGAVAEEWRRVGILKCGEMLWAPWRCRLRICTLQCAHVKT